MKLATIEIQDGRLEDLCQRFHVQELALFGSALGERFGPNSDIDLLVEFAPHARIGLLELGELKHELEALLGRDVDLVPKRGLKPILREAVLSQARLLYAA